ncbi:ATP-binding protein [Thalassotalea sp. G2M2-11]|uniref:sensor histidine kinase n=1 Tax=Thalassotalea sp. G2M2-11 TaxID=2787627 RepID=UPI0019CFFC0D|nr:ATP-binding protein [Thalassotalea sp. G2M2-11]
MGFKRFSLLIISRTVIVILAILSLVYFISTPGFHAATLLMCIVIVLLLTELFRFVKKTNEELTRFLDAARYKDFSQRFALADLGTGFGELGKTFDEILHHLQTERASQEEEYKHLKAIVEHVPVPLISYHSDQRVTLWNNAARKLFGSNTVTKLSDLSQFNDSFAQQLATMTIGETKLIDVYIDGMAHRLNVSTTQITTHQSQEILVSMQDIQTELDSAQLTAWQDLVKVLTHEIMNSITPVASLAKTAVDLIDDIKQQTSQLPTFTEELDDVANAVQTVANRSDGLMNFVGSYRRLTHLPAPDRKTVNISELLEQVKVLATQSWQEKNIELTIDIAPSTLDVYIDPNMVEQVLINLLQNAEHAVQDKANGIIDIRAKLNKRGHVMIEIADNGVGIEKHTIDKIFVPFFTTKRNGSGVGLALTRQVMLAHGGHIKVQSECNTGTTFTLIF